MPEETRVEIQPALRLKIPTCLDVTVHPSQAEVEYRTTIQSTQEQFKDLGLAIMYIPPHPGMCVCYTYTSSGSGWTFQDSGEIFLQSIDEKSVVEAGTRHRNWRDKTEKMHHVSSQFQFFRGI